MWTLKIIRKIRKLNTLKNINFKSKQNKLQQQKVLKAPLIREIKRQGSCNADIHMCTYMCIK